MCVCMYRFDQKREIIGYFTRTSFETLPSWQDPQTSMRPVDMILCLVFCVVLQALSQPSCVPLIGLLYRSGGMYDDALNVRETLALSSFVCDIFCLCCWYFAYMVEICVKCMCTHRVKVYKHAHTHVL